MWPFKKKDKASKEYEFVKKDIKKLTLSCYEVKIYNEKDDVIGETSANDSLGIFDTLGYSCPIGQKSHPGSAYVNKDEFYKFQNFRNNSTLTFEDYDENTVTIQ